MTDACGASSHVANRDHDNRVGHRLTCIDLNGLIASTFKYISGILSMEYSFGTIQKTSVEGFLAGPHTCRIHHDPHFGDEGCKRLFLWLKSGIDYEDGAVSREAADSDFPKHLSHVELVDVGLGDTGLSSLIDWLQCLQRARQVIPEQPLDRNVVSLTALDLRANKVEGTAELAEAFVSSLSTPISSVTAVGPLSSLSLSNNPLSASFRRTLLNLLPSLPGLRRLLLSFTGMDNGDATALAEFIGGGRDKCNLLELNASANNMGYMGLRTIIDAVRHCWTLEKVEMFSNGLPDNDITADETQKDLEELRKLDENMTMTESEFLQTSSGSGCGYAVLDRKLKYFLNRNIILRRRVATEALDLLRYSRFMLPRKLHQSDTSPSSEQQPWNPHTLPFSLLPTEIQLLILTHLAPHLSPKQRIRVFDYAADKTTLPSARLRLPERDPGKESPRRRPSAHSGGRHGNLSFSPSYYSPSGTRNVIVTVNSRSTEKLNQRQRWLELVGCDSYDPGDAV